MAKKRDKKKTAGAKDDAGALPKFAGWKSLAAGLEGFKAQIEKAEKAEKAEKPKQAEKAAARPREAAAPPARAPERRSAGAGDAEDELSFHRMMAGVTPLEGKANRVAVSAVSAEEQARPGGLRARAAEATARARVEAEEALDHLHALVDDAARFEVSDDGKRVEGRRVDTPPELVRRLRRGLLPIDARLDLHGLSAGQARDKIVEFLRTTRARGERCVLVIHGKGQHSANGGVLRGEIAAWLSQGKAREHVAAFATATGEDGGEGAVYVALRR